jgi:hypothetical protein
MSEEKLGILGLLSVNSGLVEKLLICTNFEKFPSTKKCMEETTAMHRLNDCLFTFTRLA